MVNVVLSTVKRIWSKKGVREPSAFAVRLFDWYTHPVIHLVMALLLCLGATVAWGAWVLVTWFRSWVWTLGVRAFDGDDGGVAVGLNRHRVSPSFW